MNRIQFNVISSSVAIASCLWLGTGCFNSGGNSNKASEPIQTQTQKKPEQKQSDQVKIKQDALKKGHLALCGKEFECGQVSVPVDYYQQNGPKTIINYEVLPTTASPSGQKQYLFMVHGGPGASHLPFHSSESLNKLRSKYTVVMYDQRGSLFSPMAEDSSPNCGKFGTRVNAYDLEVLRQRVAGNHPVVVYGHSYGGWLALRYAQLYPHFVSKLILHSSGIDGTAIVEQGKISDLSEEFGLFKRYVSKLDMNWQYNISRAYDDLEQKAKKGQLFIQLDDQGKSSIPEDALRAISKSIIGFYGSKPEKVLSAFEKLPHDSSLFLKLVEEIKISINSKVNSMINCSEFLLPSGDAQFIGECKSIPVCEKGDFTRDVGRVVSPTLIVSAELDVLVESSEQEKLKLYLPTAHFVLLKGADHVSPLTEINPAFEQVLFQFLEMN